MRIKKQVTDQSLHFTIGCVVTLLLSFFVPVLWAALAVMTFAVLREKVQHRDKSLLELGKGSFIDLAFWLLGTGLAVGLRLSGVL